jgi:hypothetical protein
MKRIKADWRANLTIPSMQRLMYISIEGPKPEDFDVKRAINLWWTSSEKGRRPGYTAWNSAKKTIQEDEAEQYALLYPDGLEEIVKPVGESVDPPIESEDDLSLDDEDDDDDLMDVHISDSDED